MILLINSISVFLLYLFSLFSPLDRILTLVIGEILVLVFEIFAAILLLPHLSRRKIILAITLANIASIVIGSFILYFPFFSY